MKKRILSGLLPLMLVCVMTAQTVRAAEPRALETLVNLMFDGTTAACSATCYGNQPSDKLEATLALYQGSTCIDSWSNSGKWRVFFFRGVRGQIGQNLPAGADLFHQRRGNADGLCHKYLPVKGHAGLSPAGQGKTRPAEVTGNQQNPQNHEKALGVI